MLIQGNYKEFSDVIGQVYLTKVIQRETAKFDAKKRTLMCEGIGDTPPHREERTLGFRHNPWKSRLDILKDCLLKYRVSRRDELSTLGLADEEIEAKLFLEASQGTLPVTENTIYRVEDLAVLVREFLDAHLPWDTSGKILCADCDKDWTAAWQARQKQETTSATAPETLSVEPLTI